MSTVIVSPVYDGSQRFLNDCNLCEIFFSAKYPFISTKELKQCDVASVSVLFNFSTPFVVVSRFGNKQVELKKTRKKH